MDHGRWTDGPMDPSMFPTSRPPDLPPAHLLTYSFMMSHRCLASLVLAVAATACGGSHTAAPAPSPARRASGAAVFVPLPDASTLAIVRMANNVEQAYARIAARRASARDVKSLVRREQASHATLNKSVDRLADVMDVAPRDNDVSLLLRDQSMPRRDSLRALSGRRF